MNFEAKLRDVLKKLNQIKKNGPESAFIKTQKGTDLLWRIHGALGGIQMLEHEEVNVTTGKPPTANEIAYLCFSVAGEICITCGNESIHDFLEQMLAYLSYSSFEKLRAKLLLRIKEYCTKNKEEEEKIEEMLLFHEVTWLLFWKWDFLIHGDAPDLNTL